MVLLGDFSAWLWSIITILISGILSFPREEVVPKLEPIVTLYLHQKQRTNQMCKFRFPIRITVCTCPEKEKFQKGVWAHSPRKRVLSNRCMGTFPLKFLPTCYVLLWKTYSDILHADFGPILHEIIIFSSAVRCFHVAACFHANLGALWRKYPVVFKTVPYQQWYSFRSEAAFLCLVRLL